MHRILFPEDTELVKQTHDSRADVEMTYKQAEAYFAGTEKTNRPVGIQMYLKKRNHNWITYRTTIDATSGDLLLPQDFKIIAGTQDKESVRKPGLILRYNTDGMFR